MGQPIDSVSVAITYDTTRSAQQFESAVNATLRDIQAEFRSAFSAIEQMATRAGADIGNDISRGGEHAESALREVDRQARTSFNRVSREASSAGTAITTKLGGALKGVAALGVATAVGGGLVALTITGLKTAAALEQIEVAFSSLLGSSKAGHQALEDLKKFAAFTPFELTDITGTAQRFLAFNQTVGLTDAQLIEFLTTLGNVASVTASGADGMQRVALALGQIASTGKVTGDNLLQISDALPGFSAIGAIAKGMGVTTAEATKLMEKGAISATDGVKFLLQGMKDFPGAAGAMEAQSKTLLGVFSTFKDTFTQSLAGAFQPIIPELKNTVETISPIIGDAMGQLAPVLGSALIELLGGVAPLITPLASILGSVLKALIPFVGLIAQAVLPAVEALQEPFAALAPVLIQLAVPVGDLIMALLPLLPALSEILVGVITLAAPLLKLVGLLVSLLATKALAPLIEFFALGFATLGEALGALGQAIMAIDWGAVWEDISGFFIQIGDSVGSFFSGIFSFFSELPSKASAAFASMRDAAIARVIALVDFVRGIPARIAAALVGLGSLLIKSGQDLIRGLWTGIIDMGSWLIGKIKAFVNDFIIGPVKAVLGIDSPSKVMAEQVGHWIPPGIEAGARDNMQSLNGMIDELVVSGRGGGEGGGTGGIVIGPGAIIIQFNGAIPTEAEAMAVGQAAGTGIVRALQKRDVTTAARMA